MPVPDFQFDGTGLSSDLCPFGWTCSQPYSTTSFEGEGTCNGASTWGVFVGEYDSIMPQCNSCMTPSNNDGYFFKIAWDNQCGYALSDSFTMPEATTQVEFLVGGGAGQAGVWVHRTSDDAVLCSFTGPPTCPMDVRTCDVVTGSGGSNVYIKLEKPCEGSGGWENYVVDDIRFKDSSGQYLSPTCTGKTDHIYLFAHSTPQRLVIVSLTLYICNAADVTRNSSMHIHHIYTSSCQVRIA